MKIIIYLSAFLSFFMFAGSCQQGVSVTFKNSTGLNFQTLKVNIAGKELIFYDLKDGQQTKPVTVPKTYRYCYAQGISLKDTLTCQPIDYVGETLLTSGKITMTLFRIQGDSKYMVIRDDFKNEKIQ